ncbi:MAG: hypothetical protein A2Z15_01500 [Chloroflexi bacterium RBG_16_50_11]|nr:MAG: hypothetical protein A2Z15_01500 [Chloroflexi bacterium RBG_16_50_11]
MRKVLRFILIFVLILLVASWAIPVAYGQTNGDTKPAGVSVEAAPIANAPAVSFIGNAIGGVTAGDLFYINSTSSPIDMSVDLYITNSDELIHHLRYLILKVAVYVEGIDGQWQPITSMDGMVVPDTYITLKNSPVTFILPGTARYKVAIESGSYYCLPFHSNSGEIAPQFYLNVEPI